MPLSPGNRLRTPASTCEVIVVKAPATTDVLWCAGAPMSSEPTAVPATPATPGAPQIALGKRYSEDGSGIEVLCVKPGPGPLAIGGTELTIKSAKPLPASD